MNHLAHLLLAHDDAESLIGNLSGDFVKGPLGDRYSPGIREGIVMHRRIDVFTDSHPAVRETRLILHGEFGHYSRIIGDVFFDHFLAGSFEEHADIPLPQFLERAFRQIDTRIDDLPERLARVYPHMRDGRWFQSYSEVDGIRQALRHLSSRLSRKPELELAADYLTHSREPLEALFRGFFPELAAYAKSL